MLGLKNGLYWLVYTLSYVQNIQNNNKFEKFDGIGILK